MGSVGIGTVLFFHNEQPLSSIFESAGAGIGPGGYIWAGFFAAVGFIGWTYVGFETAGSVAEETPDPRRDVPKAVILSLITVAAVVSYASLALILAIPDYGAVISGEVVDPVADTVTFQLGEGITKPLFVLFIIGFTASLLAIQTNCSRVMWAFARAGVLRPRAAQKLSPHARLPVSTVLTTGVIAAILLISTQSEDVYLTLISMATGGFYISFALPVVAALIAKLRGRWERDRGTWAAGACWWRSSPRSGWCSSTSTSPGRGPRRALVPGLGRVRDDGDRRGARRGDLPHRASAGAGRRGPAGGRSDLGPLVGGQDRAGTPA